MFSEIIKIVVACSLAFVLGYGSGWFQRNASTKTQQIEQQLETAKDTIKTEREIVYVTKEVVKEVEKEKLVYRDKLKIQEKEVIKYVQSPDSQLDFGVDPAWIRMFNASSLACDVTLDTCIARSEVSGRITRAEALSVALEQQELYHQCRINNNGLIDFYNRVRETVNKGVDKDAVEFSPIEDNIGK